MKRVETYIMVADWVSCLGQPRAAYSWLYKALVTCQALPDTAETMFTRGAILHVMERIR